MNESTLRRLKIFSVILLIILLAHLLIISIIMKQQPDSELVSPESPQVQTSPASQDSVPSSSATAEKANDFKPAPTTAQSTPSFLSRLFGKNRSDKKVQSVATASTLPPPPSQPVYRYKKPTGNPNFGKPFDFDTAVHGDIPADQVPGSVGATSGIMVDLATRKVLWEKKSSLQVPVASMVKMMTLLVTFEELEQNPMLSLETPVNISKTVLKVPRTGVVWLDPRETFPLSDLLKAVTIKSANDAAVQVAEFIGGDVDAFVVKMNRRATSLGMSKTCFVSPCGLPDKQKGNSMSCALDMVVLAEQLLEYPDVMRWSVSKQDFIREGDKKTVLNATNRLVCPHWPGVDGLKTGYTKDAGYCLTFTVLRNGRRIVGCVTGYKSAKERDKFCRQLIDWGYVHTSELK